MRRYIIVAVGLGLGACDADEPTQDPSDGGVTVEMGPRTDGGHDASVVTDMGPALAHLIGDPCETTRDCTPSGEVGPTGAPAELTCLEPETTRYYGISLASGMCAVECEVDEDCPAASVCERFSRDGVPARWCVPLCDPATRLEREGFRCGTNSAVLPRCRADMECAQRTSPTSTCDLDTGECVHEDGPIPDGSGCAHDGECRRGRICFEGLCTVGGCHLGGERSCAPGMQCTQIAAYNESVFERRRSLTLCLPECALLVEEQCPDGWACYPPESDRLEGVDRPVCFLESGVGAGRGEPGVGDCTSPQRHCAPRLGFVECLSHAEYLPEGRCTTYAGACANDALRAAGICGAEAACVNLPGAFTFFCWRQCDLDDPAGCRDGDTCRPYVAGRALGICMPDCRVGGFPCTGADQCDPETGACSMYTACVPDDPQACAHAQGTQRCYPVRRDINELGVQGVCLESCTLSPVAFCGGDGRTCDAQTGTCPVDL